MFFRDRGRERQPGFTLAGLIVILTIIMIFVAYTVPRQWSRHHAARSRAADDLRHEAVRALDLRVPEDEGGSRSSSIRSRKRACRATSAASRAEYIDPLTGKVDWMLVPAGAVTRTADPADRQTTANFNGRRLAEGLRRPFVGVRPPVTGKSMHQPQRRRQYENGSTPIDDLKAEINDAQTVAATSDRQCRLATSTQ